MVIDRLSDEDLYLIDSYRNAYAFNFEGTDCSGSCSPADIKMILREWNDKKERLSHLLGNKLIIEKDIEYQRPKDNLCDEMWEILEGRKTFGRSQHSASEFVNEFTNWRNKMYPFVGPWDYDYEEEISIAGKVFSHREINKINTFLEELLDPSVLADNEYKHESYEIALPNGKTYKINKGCKPCRALSKIASAYGLKGFEDFRICHSQVLNQKKLKGKLCLSIHPLDYMTMSDNNSDWGSCMSWIDDGCYRQGTVEMMNSPTVIVAYLKSSNNMEIPNGEWNNKKWRQLFIVDEKCLVSVKSYPYFSEDLTIGALSWLKELVTKNLGWTYEDDYFQYNPDHGLTRQDPNDCGIERQINFHFCTNNMYNDFGTTTHYMYFNPDCINTENNFFYIDYSGNSECMRCGKLNPDFEAEGFLVCEDCCNSHRCDLCEDYSEDLTEIDGQMICPYCLDNETEVCFIDGNTHLRYNCNALYILPEVNKENNEKYSDSSLYYGFNDPSVYFYNEYSYEELKRKILLDGKNILRTPGGEYYVKFNDLTEDAIEEIFFGGIKTNEELFDECMNSGKIRVNSRYAETHSWFFKDLRSLGEEDLQI